MGATSPTPSTVTRILHRHGLITPEASEGGLAVAPLRARCTQCAVADGLQGPFRDRSGTVPSADHPGLSLPDTAWLIRLGNRVTYSAPNDLQTNDKIERFHRSLKAEVLEGRIFANLAGAQSAFDRWHPIYNVERPHQALALHTPATRYRVAFQIVKLPETPTGRPAWRPVLRSSGCGRRAVEPPARFCRLPALL